MAAGVDGAPGGHAPGHVAEGWSSPRESALNLSHRMEGLTAWARESSTSPVTSWPA